MANTHVHLQFGGPWNGGKAITVADHTGANATLYNASGATIGNPVTADSQGYVDFYVPAGRYSLSDPSGHGLNITVGDTGSGTNSPGVGVTTPQQLLFNAVHKTAAYTAAINDVVLADATAAAFTVTLPAATVGAVVRVKKVDASVNAVTVAGAGGATVDGAANTALAAQWNHVTLVSDGTNWFVI